MALTFKANPELSLKVHQLRESDFTGQFKELIDMLSHTAANPLDISSGIVGRTMVFDSNRIHEMAEHLLLTEVGDDFTVFSRLLRRNRVDILEIVQDISKPLNNIEK